MFERVSHFKDYVQRSTRELHTKYYEEDFRYEPLPGPSYIRLLRVEPGTDSDEISCTMRAVNLDDYPKFTALSYTWRRQPSKLKVGASMVSQIAKTAYRGKDLAIEFPELEPVLSSKHTIHCNGKKLGIFSNLYEALLSFRKTGNCDGDFWMDAICMNQEDKDERTAQVKLMGRIYQGAHLVQVWLGDCPQTIGEGLPILKELSKLPAQQLPPFSSREEPRNPSVSRAAVRAKLDFPKQEGKQPLSYASAAAFSITNRPWFKRIWVLQEFFLAHNVVFFIGDHQITTDMLRTAFIWTYQDPGASGKGGTGFMPKIKAIFMPLMGSHAGDIADSFEARGPISQGRRITLREWIRTCHGRSATDPRDFVFGGLALLQEQSKIIEREKLQLEYDLDYEDVAPALPPRPAAGANTQLVEKTKAADPPVPTPLGLWDKITVDYNCSEAEVLVNLAACLMSQRDVHQFDLLSIAARPRDIGAEADLPVKPFGNMALEGLPTWAPSLGAWSSRLKSDYASALVDSGSGSTRYAAGTLHLPPGTGPCPKISRGGTTLFLDALPLDIIDKEFINLESMYGEFTSFIKSIHELSFDYPSSPGVSSFDALARTLAIFVKDNGDEVDIVTVDKESTGSGTSSMSSATTEANAPLWLCELLDNEVRWTVSQLRKNIDDATNKNKEEEDAQTAATREKSISDNQKTLEELISHYWTMVEKFGYLPWSKSADQGMEALRPAEQKQRKTQAAEEYLAEIDQSGFRGRLKGKYYTKMLQIGRDDMDEAEDAVRYERLSPGARRLGEAFGSQLIWNKAFKTKDQLLGMAPMWMEPNDRVMLVKGAPVPYLFRHCDDDLKQQIKEVEKSVKKVEKRLKKAIDGTARTWQRISVEDANRELTDLRAKIDSFQKQIGKHDAWVLVGEVYMEGAMHGEILDRLGTDSFERIAIV